MKLDFKPIRRKIDLAEYAPEMEGAVIRVQVNVSREQINRMIAVTKETSDDEFLSILQDLWGPEEWPMEDIKALFDHCKGSDPQLWIWLRDKTWTLVSEYQTGIKKN
jgi:hypothetical protein